MHEYLKNHIHEEIEGAIDYMVKALELKSTNREWASMFVRMSDMELEHANCLTKIFNRSEKPAEMSDGEYSSMQKSIIDDYTTSMSKIENMKRLYWG